MHWPTGQPESSTLHYAAYRGAGNGSETLHFMPLTSGAPVLRDPFLIEITAGVVQGILASLKALWNGNRDVSSRSVPDAASKARAAAGADGAAFEAPLQRSDSYGERLQRLHRSSSGMYPPPSHH